MDRIVDLLFNMLANAFFWLLLGAGVWVFHVMPVRREFERFFGLQNERGLTIYLSNLWAPTISTKAWGEIVAKKELDGATVVKGVFASASPGVPELVRGLVDNVWTRNKYRITIDVSPASFDLPPRNMIVVGASTKNSVRRQFLMRNELLVTIEGEPIVPPSPLGPSPLSPALIVHRATGNETHHFADGKRPAIIERLEVKHPDSGRAREVIFCVGMTGTESRLATEYLAQHWRELDAEARGKKRFARYLVYDEDGRLEHCSDLVE